MDQTLQRLRASNAHILQRIVLTPQDARRPKLYFFMKQELIMTLETLRERGMFRHCTFYNKNNGDEVYFDYIVKKEFKTLYEWITDCGSTINDVLYGVNRFDGHLSYVELTSIDDDLGTLMDKLVIENLGVPDLLVITKDRGVIGAPQFLYT